MLQLVTSPHKARENQTPRHTENVETTVPDCPDVRLSTVSCPFSVTPHVPTNAMLQGTEKSGRDVLLAGLDVGNAVEPYVIGYNMLQ